MVELSTLDHHSAVAIHEQLSQSLREQVLAMRSGSRLPTEKDLIDRHGVSRTTVRRAVQTLVDDGLLVRRQGKGTFVASKRPVQVVDRLAPFVESFTSSGLTPVASLLRYSWMEDVSEVPEALGEQAGEVLWIRRLYRADDIPMAVAEIFVPEHLARFISRADVEEHPIYQVLQERAGAEPQHADIKLTFRSVSEDVAELLDLRSGDLVPRLERVTHGSKGELLECMVAYLRPDAFELRTTVTTDHPRPVSFSFRSSRNAKPV